MQIETPTHTGMNLDQKLDLESVALPNEVPKSLNFDDFPIEITKSQAMESLIQQNQDLMARLAVGIRRYSILEEKLAQVAKDQQHMRTNMENMEDQLLVYKQKEQLYTRTHVKKQNQIDDLSDQLQLLERKYSELYTTSQNQLWQLNHDLLSAQKLVSCLKKYRSKIKPLYKLNQTNKKTLEHELRQVSMKSSQLKAQVEKANEYIQKTNKENSHEKNMIVSEYENKILQLEKHGAGQSRTLDELNKKLADQKNYREANIELQNKNIQLNRQLEELRSDQETNLVELQEKLIHYRQLSKSLTLKIEDQKEKNEIYDKQLRSNCEEMDRLKEQVENLQILWKESNEHNERLIEQNKSLQKLNQQISIELNQKRNEFKKQKDLADKSRLVAKVAKIRDEETNSSSQQEAIRTIEGLLSEIQSGFETQPHMENKRP